MVKNFLISMINFIVIICYYCIKLLYIVIKCSMLNLCYLIEMVWICIGGDMYYIVL